MTRLTIASKKQSLYEKAEEYYNSIRTNIQFSGSDIKSIVLTSVQPNEGKTTTAVNLAISMAKVGFKTLLIDADTRNSVLSGTFRAEGSIVGLTRYLSGNAELAEAICESDVSNLMVIPSGQVPPNPTNLLQNTNFTHMMEMAKQLFDYVIVDAPPIGLVVDAAIIAKHCDGAIIVTECGAIKRRFIPKAKEQLENSGTQFLGVILNKVHHSVSAYGEYGNYGDYGEYGRKSKKTRRRK
ncbi:tyrosine-protein kinase [Streptococcus sciuri]|uniref:Tyrosine-protein kinase CpsD n=1 Tax=Streptococcus sciuri TaxID=2973939 RepID=A0ABT2F675_9STRE|nr:tyrosine-protein kinase [Streptococcus sciuri]MCS4487693.1 tyrosine-protein kinase [Streptococcus sciuri]